MHKRRKKKHEKLLQSTSQSEPLKTGDDHSSVGKTNHLSEEISIHNSEESLQQLDMSGRLGYINKVLVCLKRWKVVIDIFTAIVMAIATVVMTCTTIETNKISERLASIEKQNAIEDTAARKVEFRPDIAIDLIAKEYPLVKQNGENHIVVPFLIKNMGKYVAVAINAEYRGPKVSRQNIEPEEKMDHLLPGAGRQYAPNINIGDLINDNSGKSFVTTIRVSYKGTLGTDKNTYCSEMRISIKKKEDAGVPIYVLDNSRFRVQCEE